MYSYEQRVTAVKLLIQYDMSYTTVIQELGYPNNSKTLKYWYKEYGVEGDRTDNSVHNNLHCCIYSLQWHLVMRCRYIATLLPIRLHC